MLRALEVTRLVLMAAAFFLTVPRRKSAYR
jgi:hypothetical protein